MRIAIYGNHPKDNLSDSIQELFNKLEKRDAETLVFQPFLEILKQKIKIPSGFKTFTEHADLSGRVDCLLSLGGGWHFS